MPKKSEHKDLLNRIANLEQQVAQFKSEAAKYRTLFDSFPHGITVSDAQGNIIETNAAAERLLGVNKEEHEKRAIGGREWRIIRPDGTEMPPGEWASVIALKEKRLVADCEMGIAKSDDEVTWINVTAAPLSLDGYGVVVTYSDITERKAAEQNLRIYQDIVSSTPEGVAFLDKNYRYIIVNDAYENFSGVKREKFIGLTVAEYLGEDIFKQQIKPNFDRCLEGGGVCFQEWFEYPRLGKRFVEVTYYPYKNAFNQIAGVVANTRDITERKLAEEEKAQIEEQFRQVQRLESVGRLAGGVAHDLNNLLTPIIGYGEMLLEDTVEGDSRSKSLEEIVNAGMRAKVLIRQLLAFSRKQKLEFSCFDLNVVLNEFKTLLRRTIRQDIVIHVALDPSLPFIRGDVGQLEQVVMNLAVNAQDAMPNGGELTLETTMIELDETYARQHKGVTPGNYVMLAVSDTGCGIDTKIRDRLFEPFFTTKAPDKGTGLGLATVYGIVKQHGGNIWLYSESGLGTTFKIYLPESHRTGESENGELIPFSDLCGSESILLVDDDEHVRTLAHTILEQNGYTVFAAANGKEAFDLLERHDGRLHLLLTDVVMPEMDGKQLYEKISAEIPKIRVIYMSGYTGNVIVRRGVTEPGPHFIQKPFSGNDLLARVRTVLDEDR